MKNRIALLIYPEFSLQEVANLMYLFRWHYNTVTDVIYTDKEIVKSEEGINIMPTKTCDEFSIEDYDCLILPGCSDTRMAIRNLRMNEFLRGFKNNSSFIIGAICAGPLFLQQADLLKGKKYTDSLYVEMRELFSFIDENNFLPMPVVEDGNIVTANGSAFNDFAVHIARKIGYDCPVRILSGYIDDWKADKYFVHLPQDKQTEFINEFHDLICK